MTGIREIDETKGRVEYAGAADVAVAGREPSVIIVHGTGALAAVSARRDAFQELVRLGRPFFGVGISVCDMECGYRVQRSAGHRPRILR